MDAQDVDAPDVDGQAPADAGEPDAGEAAADAPAAPAASDPDAASEDDELVSVDHIGQPTVSTMPALTRDVVITAFGLTEASRQRFLRTGQVELCEDSSRLEASDAVIVSTRLPRAELADTLSEPLATTHCPLVALTHTGGEAQAVEIMRAGGTAVIGEGNEDALAALLGDQACDTGLLESYARQLGRAVAGGGGARGLDPVTRLPDLERLEERLDELTATDDVPRVGAIRVLELDLAARQLNTSALALLRRRLARLFAQVCESEGATLYAVDTSSFAFLSMELSPHRVEDLGRRLGMIARTFHAGGVGPFEVAIGHAGAEAATNPTMLRELALRALQVSVVDRSRHVVSAETLALGSSGTIELETASRLLALAELHLPQGTGHGARVARVAAELARELGFDAPARTSLEVAAHFHQLGLASLPPASITALDSTDEQVRTHPVRAWSYLRVCAGPAAATAVRHHAEHWDGTGYPDGLAGRAIPLEARIVALAIALQAWRSRRGPDPRELAGTVLDPDLVPVAMAAVGTVDNHKRALSA